VTKVKRNKSTKADNTNTMSFNLTKLIRENIKSLTPYSSARDEFHGEAKVFLDANENAIGSPLLKWYNRYPDPHQQAIKEKLSAIKGVPTSHIFIGNGSDECIDILFRSFCNPGKDNVIICPPTYGMYEVSANINDVELRKAPLLENFQLDLIHLETLIDANTKLIWICSPNNPTGNSIYRDDIEMVLNNFDGIVVIDEAYINFSRQRSFIPELKEYPNLVVMHTLSKAWGLAGLRLGMAFASEEIISILNKVKPPYNISEAVQELVMKALDNTDEVNQMIQELVKERKQLEQELQQLKVVEKIYPSDANFLLVKTVDAKAIYTYLIAKGIVVRNRSNVTLCENCLRITVGTSKENGELTQALQEFMI
jgi:histidinol-phosphate aminotransferase